MTCSRRILSRIFILCAAILPAAAIGQAVCTTGAKKELYAAVGPDLIQYVLDLNAATLTKRSSVTAPADVQEAAALKAAPSKDYLYVAWSNLASLRGVPEASQNHQDGVSAFQIDPATGALLPHGGSISL